MIRSTYSKSVNELDMLIKELEKTYKTFKLVTILPITSGYIMYYELNGVNME